MKTLPPWFLERRLKAVTIAAVLALAACTMGPTPELDIEPGAQTSTLQASPNKLVADGYSQALVVLCVRNRSGAPVPNVRATLEIEPHPRPDLVWLVQPGPTDSNGKTTGIILSETPGDLSVLTRLPAHTQSAKATLRAKLTCVAPG